MHHFYLTKNDNEAKKNQEIGTINVKIYPYVETTRISTLVVISITILQQIDRKSNSNQNRNRQQVIFIVGITPLHKPIQ